MVTTRSDRKILKTPLFDLDMNDLDEEPSYRPPKPYHEFMKKKARWRKKRKPRYDENGNLIKRKRRCRKKKNKVPKKGAACKDKQSAKRRVHSESEDFSPFKKTTAKQSRPKRKTVS